MKIRVNEIFKYNDVVLQAIRHNHLERCETCFFYKESHCRKSDKDRLVVGFCNLISNDRKHIKYLKVL